MVPTCAEIQRDKEAKLAGSSQMRQGAGQGRVGLLYL